MKSRLIGSVVASLVLLSSAVNAQEQDRPSLLAPPWAGPPNIAAEVASKVISGIDSMGYFDRVDWEGLIASSPVTRDMPESRRAGLGCIQGRQLAGLEDIAYVLCGTLRPTPDGIRIELELWDLEAGRRIAFDPLVASDQGSLVEHALTEIRGWDPRGGDFEARKVSTHQVRDVGCFKPSSSAAAACVSVRR